MYTKQEITESLRFWPKRMRHWWNMVTGKSYYHRPQNLGRVFKPGELRGYFNDLTAKTSWPGEVDRDGIPVGMMSNGQKFQFPILITQKALGHWDMWLIENNEEDRTQFLRLCDWLLKHQDENGGWDTWQPLRGQKCAKYSAMTQGQALSLLSRAWSLTGDSRYRQAAERAFGLFLVSAQEGGVTYFDGDAAFLEETPAEPRNTVLNGWIFALFGLYDHSLAFDNSRVRDILERSIDSLARRLPSYDNGYWSYYDCHRRLASPFYHNLHISQLEAVSLISDNPVFDKYHRRWALFQQKVFNRTCAFIVKGFQKLREPARVTIVQ